MAVARARSGGQKRGQAQVVRSSGSEEAHRCGFVAVVGRPNAGKSSLVNSAAGGKLSIVTRKANTTRQSILALASGDAFQAVLLDTPGVMRFQTSRLDSTMMSNLRSSVSTADAIVLLLDASSQPLTQLHELAPPSQRPLSAPCLVAVNKADLLTPDSRSRLTDALLSEDPPLGDSLLVSAETGENVSNVLDWAVQHLPESPALYPKDLASEHDERFFVSEMVRETALELYQQEIPYAMFVSVPYFKERPNAKDYVLAEITVERESQKAIVLGHKGQALKKLSTEARHAIEDFLGRPIYLDMNVRVQSKWRKRSAASAHYETYDRSRRM